VLARPGALAAITQSLSTTGLTCRAPSSEFWLFEDEPRRQDPRHAGLDFGTVYEDAVDFQPTSCAWWARHGPPGGGARAGWLDGARHLTNAQCRANDEGILGDVVDIIRVAGPTRWRACRCAVGAERGLVVQWRNLRTAPAERPAGYRDLNNDQHLDTDRGEREPRPLRFRVGTTGYVRDGGALRALASGGCTDPFGPTRPGASRPAGGGAASHHVAPDVRPSTLYVALSRVRLRRAGRAGRRSPGCRLARRAERR
jgi:hypothetical protein